MSRRLTTEEYVKKCQATHGDRYDYNNVRYVHSDTKVAIICKVHGLFQQWPSDHRRGFGCPQCSGKAKHTTESFIELARSVHGELYDYSTVVYEGMNALINITCRKHGIFQAKPTWHVHGTQIGCPVCNASKGEIRVEEVLKQIGVAFEKQKTFKGCRGRFDFYIPSINLCIEYDGAQHFSVNQQRSRDLNERQQMFEDIKRRDSVKNKYCKEKGIDLLRINYTQYSNIELLIKVKIK